MISPRKREEDRRNGEPCDATGPAEVCGRSRRGGHRAPDAGGRRVGARAGGGRRSPSASAGALGTLPRNAGRHLGGLARRQGERQRGLAAGHPAALRERARRAGSRHEVLPGSRVVPDHRGAARAKGTVANTTVLRRRRPGCHRVGAHAPGRRACRRLRRVGAGHHRPAPGPPSRPEGRTSHRRPLRQLPRSRAAAFGVERLQPLWRPLPESVARPGAAALAGARSRGGQRRGDRPGDGRGVRAAPRPGRVGGRSDTQDPDHRPGRDGSVRDREDRHRLEGRRGHRPRHDPFACALESFDTFAVPLRGHARGAIRRLLGGRAIRGPRDSSGSRRGRSA